MRRGLVCRAAHSRRAVRQDRKYTWALQAGWNLTRTTGGACPVTPYRDTRIDAAERAPGASPAAAHAHSVWARER